MIALWLAAAPAVAGYGDAEGGVPSPVEREVHLWTNAVRADPAHFTDAYPCSFSGFQPSEKTPKALLRWDQGLGEAARYHSTDMDVRSYFQHDSIDGTPWDARIFRYYDGTAIGENIAFMQPDAYGAVIEGWMCSSGHRANIMLADFNELGTGVSGTYYTQDFGVGSGPDRGMVMGAHLPAVPTGSTVELAVALDRPAAPDDLFVMLSGERLELVRDIGEDARGVYTTEVPNDIGCHDYYFVMVAAGVVETFPEVGAYGWGGCTFDDVEAGWLATRAPLPADVAELAAEDGSGCGCAAAPVAGASWLVVPLALVARRR